MTTYDEVETDISAAGNTVESVWVELESNQAHIARLNKFVQRGLLSKEASCAMLVGPTGVGKSRLLDRLLTGKHFLPYENERGTMRPLIRFEAPDTPTTKSIALKFLETQGCDKWEEESRSNLSQNVFMERVFKYLRGQETKLIVIDEAQGFLARSGTYAASDFLKRILNQAVCPIILCGLPNTLNLFDNQQLIGRCSLVIEVKAYDWFNAKHQLEYRQVLKGIQLEVDALRSGVSLSSMGMSRGLNYATFGLLRETRQLLDAAIEAADGMPLAAEHLAIAFDQRSPQRRAISTEKRGNPFLPGTAIPDTWRSADSTQGQKTKKTSKAA